MSKLFTWHWHYYEMQWRDGYIRRSWCLWLRLRNGLGLHFSNRPKAAAYFSERNGYRKVLYVFGLRVELLEVTG